MKTKDSRKRVQEKRRKKNAAFLASSQTDFGGWSHMFAKRWKQTVCEMWVLELDLEKVISELSGISRTACFCMVSFKRAKTDFSHRIATDGKDNTCTFLQDGLYSEW